MKINQEYMRKMIDVFTDSPRNSVRYFDFPDAGIALASKDNPDKFDEQFLEHISYLVENGFISNQQPTIHTLKSIGIRVGEHKDTYVSSEHLLLTPSGRDFASHIKAVSVQRISQ